jgi:pimeloyl-ACP methyl ester carboxylesterase
MWLTHLEFDATNPFMRHWFDAMGERGRYVRYDARGCGPSEPAPAEISFDRWVDDLEAVAASVSDDPVNVLGFSQGAAVAIGFAVRRWPPSSPAVATGAHLMTTPSTSPWPSWPGRRSGTPPSRGRLPRSPLPVSAPAGGVDGPRRPVRPPRAETGVTERQLAVPVCDAGLVGRLWPAVMRPGGIEFRLHPDGTRAPGRSSRRGVR